MRGFILTSATSLALGLIAAGAIHDASHCQVSSMQNLMAPASNLPLLYRRLASHDWSDPISFVQQASAAVVLVTLSLSLQSGGMAALIRWGSLHFAQGMYGLQGWRGAVFMVRFTSALIVLHVTQILLWAAFYRWNCFPTWGSSFYFSTASYSTVGYGDVVLPLAWRTLGPLESITGVLMCGLSASFLFAIVHRLVGREVRFSSEKNPARVPDEESEE
jgi:voltage-gated potassium channel